MGLRRTIRPTRRRFADRLRPVTAIMLGAVLAVGVVVAVTTHRDIVATDGPDVAPVSATSNSVPLNSGSTVTVSDPAIATQGSDQAPVERAVKEFTRDEEFSQFALTWTGDRDIIMFVRAQADDGSWGEWYDAEAAGETRSDGTNGTELLYVKPTHTVQVSVSGLDLVNAVPDDIQAVFIDGNAGEAPVAGGIDLTADSDGMPKIISRAGWGADESIRTLQPTYDDKLSAIIIHHTAGSNDYTAAEAAGIVRGIYQYHAQTLGWGDIGYNALVDKYGNIYEGRYGGINRNVEGAHAGGFNQNTWGISMMGNYSTVSPSSATIRSVGQLAGWRARIAGFDPLGSDTHVSEGTSYTFIPAGQSITLPNIFAHRDVGNTECPGDAGYAKMSQIRQIAEETYASGGNITMSDGTSLGGTSNSVLGNALSQLSSEQNLLSRLASGDKNALLTVAGTILGLVITGVISSGTLSQLTTGTIGNVPIIGQLSLSQVPKIITSVLSLTGNSELSQGWNRINTLFGAVLGDSTGAATYAAAADDRNSVVGYAPFENGIITTSPEAGTHALWGVIAETWAKTGFDAGALGLPINEEYRTDAGLIRVDFQGGYITFDPATGAVDAYAPALDALKGASTPDAAVADSAGDLAGDAVASVAQDAGLPSEAVDAARQTASDATGQVLSTAS